MRTLILLSVVCCLFAGGCFEDVGRGIDEFAGGLLGINSKVEATVAEIDAAGQLESDDAKRQGLLTIARRSGLGKREQVHLVETTYNELTHELSKVDIFLALIGNVDFCHEAKKTILNNLSLLSSEDNKANIVGAINVRVIGVKTDIPQKSVKSQDSE